MKKCKNLVKVSLIALSRVSDVNYEAIIPIIGLV